MVEVKNLSKRYGAKQALSNISFTARSGEILGFLGPNGAGKTTTMNIITGYISATEGTVRVNGAEILEEPRKVKSQIGYLPEHPPLYMDMTVKEYLSFLFDLKKVKLPHRRHMEEICELVQIGGVYGRRIKNLSKGYRQRVGLAQAMLGNPDILILDEPTVGLDPKQIMDMRELIRQLGEKRTVILSSHILSEIQAVCGRVIVINNGRLVTDDTPQNLSHTMSNSNRLTLRVAGEEEPVFALLCALEQVQRVEKLGMREPGSFDFALEPREKADVRRALFAALAEKGWPILELRGQSLSLEEIFLRLTQPEEPDEPDESHLGEQDELQPDELQPNEPEAPDEETAAGQEATLPAKSEHSEQKGDSAP